MLYVYILLYLCHTVVMRRPYHQQVCVGLNSVRRLYNYVIFSFYLNIFGDLLFIYISFYFILFDNVHCYQY